MKEIKFDKYSFAEFNKDDRFGLFNDKIHRIVNGLGRIDPSSTSLFDYDEYIKKLLIYLFMKYDYVVVTDKNCFWGVLKEARTLIKSNIPDAYQNTERFNERSSGELAMKQQAKGAL
jgi:hypothetical protein